MKKKALILDRDGVICKALGGYLTSIDQFELIPGILDVIRVAKEKAYIVVVVTNQPQIAKGLLSAEHLEEIHTHMHNLLDKNIDRIYHCPHTDEHNCDCRKPKSGMLLRAAEDFDLDLTQSIMVGDGDKDILAGHGVGCITVFIKNPVKEKYLELCEPDHVFDSITSIIEIL